MKAKVEQTARWEWLIETADEYHFCLGTRRRASRVALRKLRREQVRRARSASRFEVSLKGDLS